MSDFFPFFGDVVVESSIEEIPLYTEIAWDFERNSPIIENGQFKIVTGNEAIKTWCYKSLQVNRYKHIIYSWNYACELEKLIGKPYSKALAQAECIRYVEECLMINPYIIGVSNIQSSFKDGLLSITCDLNTIYGSTSLEGVRISSV